MQLNPKVSVLIPTYNYGHFLDEAIQSILQQTYSDFELVIVDNCSTDNTAEVVGKYLSDPRISYHVNERNLGLVGNWNKCLDLARGEYIKFLCADDKLHPELLEKFVRVMEEHPGVMIVSSYSQFFGDKHKERTTPFTGLINGRKARQHILVEGKKNWVGEPTTLMFRSSGLVVGRFNPALVQGIDIEYWLRLLTLGDCYIVPEVLSYFRWHNASQTADTRNKKFEKTFDFYRFLASIRKFNQETGNNDIPNLEAQVHMRASRVAALSYRVLPQIYKKENRAIFRKAWQIGYSEGVLLDPLLRLFKGSAKIKIKPKGAPVPQWPLAQNKTPH